MIRKLRARLFHVTIDAMVALALRLAPSEVAITVTVVPKRPAPLTLESLLDASGYEMGHCEDCGEIHPLPKGTAKKRAGATLN